MTQGSYCLVVYVNKNELNLRIGKLGKLKFRRGYYFYVGSAMGLENSAASLENRIKRYTKIKLNNNNFQKFKNDNNINHFYNIENKKSPKIHWHIDFLLKSEFTTIIKIYLIPSTQKLECEIAKFLFNLCDNFIERFGCSDCKCDSHLFYFKDLKNFI